MLAVIAEFTIRDGSQNDSETIIAAKFRKDVTASEPGCALFQVTRSQGDPSRYKVLELYADADALNAHLASERFAAVGKAMSPSFAQQPNLETLDAI